jgi:excisionase family DNA binding protein
MTDAQSYYTVKAAADILGVDRIKISRLIHGGELRAIKNPLDKRERLIVAEDVDRLQDLAESVKKAVA